MVRHLRRGEVDTGYADLKEHIKFAWCREVS